MGTNEMTIDKLIDICERESKRGAHTAKYSKYDSGYADAFKLCLTFAKELKESLDHDHDMRVAKEAINRLKIRRN